MTPAAGAMLRLLGSGVNLARGIVSGGGSGGPTPIEGASFEELLARAGGGSLRAAEPVRVASGSGVELSSGQLERVGEAAARLESRGASRGVILIDGQALEYDVLTRTITGTVDLDSGAVASQIDAVVRAPAADEDAGVLKSAGALGAGNRSLLEALGRD